MLVRFHSPAHHDITMFGAIAKELIHLMGFSGRIPSAVEAPDLPGVRARLIAALDAPPPPAADADAEDSDNDEAREPPVPMKTRAQPLLAMIDAAIRQDEYVMWEETR